MVGGAAAGSAGDASAARLCLWRRLGCPGRRRVTLRLVVLHRFGHFGLLLVWLTFVGCIRRQRRTQKALELTTVGDSQ